MKDNKKLVIRISFAVAFVLILGMLIGLSAVAEDAPGGSLDVYLLGSSTLAGKEVKATAVLASKQGGLTLSASGKYVASSAVPGTSVLSSNTLATGKFVPATKGGPYYLLTFKSAPAPTAAAPIYIYEVSTKNKPTLVGSVTAKTDRGSETFTTIGTNAVGKVKQELSVLGLSVNDAIKVGSTTGKVKKDSTSVTIAMKEKLTTTSGTVTISRQPFYGNFDATSGYVIDAPLPATEFTQSFSLPAILTQTDAFTFEVKNAKAKSDLVVLYNLTPGAEAGIFNYAKGKAPDGSKDEFIKGGTVKAGRSHVVFDGVTLKGDANDEYHIVVDSAATPAKIKKDNSADRRAIPMP